MENAQAVEGGGHEREAPHAEREPLLWEELFGQARASVRTTDATAPVRVMGAQPELSFE